MTRDAASCGLLCAGWTNSTDPSQRCNAFTFYNQSAPGQLEEQNCYGHTTVTWFPTPSAIATSGQMLWPCSVDTDCSLNGVCSGDASNAGEGKACVCDKGWAGVRCGIMQLQLVDKSQRGYKEVDSDGKNISSWGGGVVKVKGEDKYHMYVCVMTLSCGIGSWFTNSAVVHAVSSSPLGPFTKVGSGLTFPPFSTNPTVALGPKNEAVLVMGMATANGSAPAGPSRECTQCTWQTLSIHYDSSIWLITTPCTWQTLSIHSGVFFW